MSFVPRNLHGLRQALTRACREGYLTGVFMLLPWWSLDPIHAAVPSTNPSRKGGHHLLYRHTAKPVPAHVCGVNVVGAQGDTRYDGGSKTAPGVASTNTESLAHSSGTSREEA